MCHRVSHGEKTCEEVKAEEEILKNPVHRAHEKMSAATIRRCPTCLVCYSKLDGCNKMTCRSPGCNTLSCYLCQEKIEGYSHFCNHKRTSKKPCPCGKLCELWTSTDEMIRLDREARRKAGRDVLEAAGMAPEKIELVLASPPGKKKAAPRGVPQPASPAAAVPVLNPRQNAAAAHAVPQLVPPAAAVPVLNPRQNAAAAHAFPRPVPPVAAIPVLNPQQNAEAVQAVPQPVPPMAAVPANNYVDNPRQHDVQFVAVFQPDPPPLVIPVDVPAQNNAAHDPQPQPEVQEENDGDADDQDGEVDQADQPQPQPEVQEENDDDFDDQAEQFRRRERCIIL